MADYLNTELEIVKFSVDDIIATSPGLTDGGNLDPNNPGDNNNFPG